MPPTQTELATAERLEQLAAWHRANAEHAGSTWVWEARLRTAEELERRAAVMRVLDSRSAGGARQRLAG